MLSRSRVISSSAPNGSSIRSSAGSNDERARDRDALLHPARELPGPARLETGQLDELEHLGDPLLPPRPVPAEQLERQRDVPHHRPPVVEDRVLEDDSVVVVEAGLVRRLPVHEQRPRARLDQVADDAEERRLAAARRADERDELPRRDLEIDVLERRHAGAKGLREPLDRDDALGACSCEVLRRASQHEALGQCDEAEEHEPEHRADDVRRPQERGLRASSTG